MYDNILKRLGIEGENESDRFRSLIEFLFDYVDDNPIVPAETRIERSSGDSSRLDVLDLLIQSLREHESNLDKIAAKLERSATTGTSSVDNNMPQTIQHRLIKE
jgi:hypothetical protein